MIMPKPKMGRAKKWTAEEIQLISNWKGEWNGLLPLLPDRTKQAILSKIGKLGIHRIVQWTDAEKALVEKHYPHGGWKAVARAGVNRTEGAIHRIAAQLGCRFGGKDWTKIYDVVRRCYEDGLPFPGKRAARELDISVGRVYSYAANLGLYTRGVKSPNWSEFEVALLEKNMHKSALTISRILYRAGYKRTAAAVELKRRCLGFSREQSDYLTPSEIGQLLGGFDASAVIKWIKSGQLRGAKRGYQKETDHWLVHEKHLRLFVLSNPEILRRYWARIDPLWLIGGLLNTTCEGKAVATTDKAA
jgi:hypothetical protein